MCADDPGLEVAGAQKAAAAQIKKFLGVESGNSRPGLLMCMLCLTMWTLTVSCEINGILSLSRAVWHLPRGVTRVEISGDSAHFCAITLRCCCFVLAVQLLRLILAGTLLVCGALWLAYETDIPNLLLNAVALEFVFNVDELIFESLAPLQFKHLLGLVAERPLSVPPLKRWSGLDSVSTLSAVLSAAFVMAMFGVYLLPYEAVLFATRDAICGGESGERRERACRLYLRLRERDRETRQE